VSDDGDVSSVSDFDSCFTAASPRSLFDSVSDDSDDDGDDDDRMTASISVNDDDVIPHDDNDSDVNDDDASMADDIPSKPTSVMVGLSSRMSVDSDTDPLCALSNAVNNNVAKFNDICICSELTLVLTLTLVYVYDDDDAAADAASSSS
jgi:hypothetical protein